jgi:hypothetical protein
MLLDGIVQRLKTSIKSHPPHNLEELYGAGKGLWEEDAQDCEGARLREDRYRPNNRALILERGFPALKLG